MPAKHETNNCEFAGEAAPPQKQKPGPKADPDKVKPVHLNIYARPEDAEYLLTWSELNPTLAFAQLIEDMRKSRPGGRHSVPVMGGGIEAKNRPGTKTSMKRYIATLKEQLLAAGIEPAPETSPIGEVES